MGSSLETFDMAKAADIAAVGREDDPQAAGGNDAAAGLASSGPDRR